MTNRAIEPLDGYTSLLGILEGATRRYPGRGAFGLFQDDGAGDRWTFEELDARSRAVAWRLRNEHSLARGDRLLTWSPDGEILVRGPGVFQGYWRNAEATSAAFSADGFYRTGDLAERRADGAIVLRGRKKEMIVLPSGLKVFPEDIENALCDAGVADAVVLETAPGRIEAVLPKPAGHGTDDGAVRSAIDTAVRAANSRLGIYQRVHAWRFWPENELPRTHTMKVKRALVRERILGNGPLLAASG